MKCKKLLTAVAWLVSMFASGLLWAAADEELSLLDAIRLTLENNPQFQTYRLRSEALDGEFDTARLKPPLRASSEIENVIGTGDLKWFQGTELTLALSQLIELGDKRGARTNVVSQRQNLLQAEQRILELELLSETTTRYIELAAAIETGQLLSRATQLAQDLLDEVSQRVDAGRAPDAERARAAAALARAMLTEQSSGFAVDAARVSLSSLWGLLRPDFTGIEADLMTVEILSDIDQLLTQLENNPAIEVFASETRLREAELRAARSLRETDIEVGAGIRHLAGLNDTAFLFQVNMPLKPRHRARGAITTAQANLLRVESEMQTALLKMQAQLLVLDQQRRSAVNEFNTLQTSVLPQLQEALEATRIAFGSGRYSYLELSAAQQELLDAELALIETATRAHLLRVEVERLSGETYRTTLDTFEGGNQQ